MPHQEKMQKVGHIEAPPALHRRFSLADHWTTQELVTLGVFAAVIKASTLIVAYMGGGMNPVTLMAKNCLFATLMIVLLHKIPKIGTLTLATVINSLVSFLIMGQGVVSTLALPLICFLAEGLMFLLGGYGKSRNILIGVLVLEICSKATGLGLAWLMTREQPGLLVVVSIFIAIGTLGTLLGLYTGLKFTKELRHAGIISN